VIRKCSPSFSVVAVLSLGAAACSKEPHALTASSAGQSTYALGYVDSLTSTRTEEAAVESQVGTATTALSTYPAALSGPSWKDVMVVYTAADTAGRSNAYVEELERDQAVLAFYVDEKDELNRRVGGAAQYAAKQKQCDVELTGPTSYALGKAFEDRIRERLRKHSDAFLYISDHEDSLGKKNRPKLEDQSDAITQTSYFVYVAAPKLRERLARQANESSDVDHTLRYIAEDAHRVATDEKNAAQVRSRAEEREQAAIGARQHLAAEVSETQKLADDMDKRIARMRDQYEAALKALKKDVEGRAR
jgi:hypothetical protein